MNLSNLFFLLLAVPSILGSVVILYLAVVGKGVWISHSAAIAVACVLALAGNYISKLVNQQIVAFTIIFLTCIALISTITGDSSGPERWLLFGSFSLYVAPILLPSFIAACAVVAQNGNKHQLTSFIAILCVAILLALQPDASQVLGLLVASIVIAKGYRLGAFRSGMIFFPLLLVTIWAFSIPDPLEPVPYVEEVFKLAFGHSIFAGIAVIAAASSLIVGLWIKSVNGRLWLSAVAAYYTVLFVCSTAGITPAPFVGYGAGPILGFGLMAGLHRCFELNNTAGKSMQPATNAAVD